MSREEGDGGDAPPLFLLTLVMVNKFQKLIAINAQLRCKDNLYIVNMQIFE